MNPELIVGIRVRFALRAEHINRGTMSDLDAQVLFIVNLCHSSTEFILYDGQGGCVRSSTARMAPVVLGSAAIRCCAHRGVSRIVNV